MMDKILIIEDDINISKGLGNLLNKYNYSTATIHDFSKIDEEVKELKPKLILLDINLPYYDGFYWCNKIRQHSIAPIIIISARDSSLDQVIALNNGADDYINKPFDNDVLIAKIKSHLRRSYGEYIKSTDNRETNGLLLNKDRLTIEYKGKEAFLSLKEMNLLQSLMEEHGKTVNRNLLLEKVWDDNSFVESNTLNVNINRLRKRLEELGLEDVLKTIRGLGYQLNIPNEQS